MLASDRLWTETSQKYFFLTLEYIKKYCPSSLYQTFLKSLISLKFTHEFVFLPPDLKITSLASTSIQHLLFSLTSQKGYPAYRQHRVVKYPIVHGVLVLENRLCKIPQPRQLRNCLSCHTLLPTSQHYCHFLTKGPVQYSWPSNNTGVQGAYPSTVNPCIT